MSVLAGQAELIKLGDLLGVAPDELPFLADVPAESLRLLREAISDHLLREDRPLFRRLARLARRMPPFLTVRLARRLDPMLVAGIVVEVPAKQAAKLALRVDPESLADVCTRLDPRRSRELIRRLPTGAVVDIAMVLDARDDFVTMSRFVDFLSDDTILAVEEAIPDEGRLLRIAYLMESKNRVDHIFRMLPQERIRRLFARIAQDPESLLAEFLSLLIHVSYGFKRELGDILVTQDEDVINGYILAADRRGLWPDVLPSVAAMSATAQRRVVNLPALRERAVQGHVLGSAHTNGQWGLVLPLVELMDRDNRDAVADILATMPAGAVGAAVDAALVGEYWPVLVDVVARATAPVKREFARSVSDIESVDSQLYRRVVDHAADRGIDVAALRTRP